ncbi:GNAT family N-acetyltransferase [Gottfriedia acidiceleris]|uniref:GNAT family N-acetyltransferase n=1 Tax=Bacillaceae TaxID=186817 RepID=UPI000BEBEA7C|nr:MULTISPECIES: GNAT family N-acetyltransferase [unclassified Bacillus (in: firmicutes)]PEC50328.1 GNAT family N-acetyltransferase [Bacillus sp. AFS096315]PFM74962.1 GNAT family N-acetyltransferase [Bacillus sp. AFS077874]
MFPILETERIVLRELVVDDALVILNCFSNDEVLRYYGQRPLKSIEQVKQIIISFSKSFEEKSGIKWGIELKETGTIIGTIGFQDWSHEHKRANISYALFPDNWGRGYASEAIEKVISWGFQELGLERIGAIVFIENEASNNLLIKTGFQKEGILKHYMYQNGVAHDTNVFSLLKKK